MRRSITVPATGQGLFHRGFLRCARVLGPSVCSTVRNTAPRFPGIGKTTLDLPNDGSHLNKVVVAGQHLELETTLEAGFD